MARRGLDRCSPARLRYCGAIAVMDGRRTFVGGWLTSSVWLTWCDVEMRRQGRRRYELNRIMRIFCSAAKEGWENSLAAATGLELSRLGYRTLVMSVDPAHSLADAFDIETELFHGKTGIRTPSTSGWPSTKSTSRRKSSVTGRRSPPTWCRCCAPRHQRVEAEELAILPGMEELSA